MVPPSCAVLERLPKLSEGTPMTSRGLLLAVLVSLILWLLIYLLAVTGWRAVDEAAPPSRVGVASEGRAFMFDLPVASTTTTHPPKPVARTGPTVPVSSVPPSERWTALADCESGDGDGRAPYSMTDNYRGLHHGALQWHPDTWARARRMSGLPVAESAADAPFADEVAVAKVWLRATSPRQWPVCGPRVGLSMADAA